jgi:hypothetical protein
MLQEVLSSLSLPITNEWPGSGEAQRGINHCLEGWGKIVGLDSV